MFDLDVSKAVRASKGGLIRVEESYDYNPTSRMVLEYVEEIEANGDFALDYETPEKSSAEVEEELLGAGKTEIQVAGLSARLGHCLGVPGDMLSLLKPLFTRRRAKPVYCRVFNWGFEGYHSNRQWGDLTVTPIDLMRQLERCYSDLKRKDLGTALSIFTDMPYTKNLSKTDPNRYNACDTYGTLWGSRNAESYMRAIGNWQASIETDPGLWDYILDAYTTGINCDVPHAQRLELLMYKTLEAYETWWHQNIPLVDWQSPQQLLALFKSQGLPIILRKRVGKNKQVKQTPSVDQDVLETYRDKHNSSTAGLILTMRSLKKASDFTHIYSSDGRAHPEHRFQRGGRIQARDPDLQNLPEELAGIHPRSIILPDNPASDCIISADFEAIEFYIYGYAAQDRPILQARADGTYIYGLFYQEIFHENFFEPGKPPKKPYRRKDIPPWKLLIAKSGPLGMLYGRGPKSLQDGFGISKSEAYRIYDGFFREHWAVARLHEALLKEAEIQGYLKNYFGRIRRFPNVRGMRNEILSFPGQSNAVDILVRNAILPIRAGIARFNGRFLFPVHDSVQVSAGRASLSGAVGFVRDCMEAPIPEMNNYWIPCTVKVGTLETSTTGKPNWNDLVTWEDFCLEHSRPARNVQKLSQGEAAKPATPVV